MLIQARHLYDLIISESSKEQLIIFDCRSGDIDAKGEPESYTHYKQGHLPGAIYINLERDLSGPVTEHSGRHPLLKPASFVALLQAMGVTAEKKVVIYDDNGSLFAARLWWMLTHWVNLDDVVILDGGQQAWERENLPLSRDIPIPVSVNVAHAIDHSRLVSMTDIQSIVDSSDANALLVDARANNRFLGKEEPIDPVAGHIPGAVNAPCIENLQQDKTFHSRSSLESQFASVLGNSHKSDQIIHYCGSGITACHNIFAMELAGLSSGSLYAGSWSQWISYPLNAIEP